MSVIVRMEIPKGCQKCKFFKKHFSGNGIDYSYSCALKAKEFPIPWIRQENERASDCPLKSVDGLIEKIARRVISNPSGGVEEEDKPYNQGLQDAISIIKEYCGMEVGDGTRKI